MSKLINIKNNLNIKTSNELIDYLNPSHVYIPYKKTFKLNIKVNDQVYMNGLILHSEDNYVYTPVSGKIIGACESVVDGKKNPTIIIENDFREKVPKVKGIKKDIYNYDAISLNNELKKYNAISEDLKGTILVVNGIDYEPFEQTMSYLIKDHLESILQGIDALIKILNIEKCYLAINNSDSNNVTKLVNEIGTYPNIKLKLMPDLYPIGKKEVLVNELNLSKHKDNIIFLSVEDIFAIYNVLKKEKPITEKFVTFSGDLLDTPKVLKIKIGTNIGDVINDMFKITGSDYDVIINGLLSGYKIDNLNAVITPNIRSVFINSKVKQIENECINCGLCISHCPVGAKPNQNKDMNLCIKCGLCNYICPSKRTLVRCDYE